MINPELLAIHFGRSAKLLLTNLEGITHEQSLWRPTNANSLNWLVGHIVASRSGFTHAIGFTPVWDEATRQRYGFGSAPIEKDGDGVLPLERLIADFTSAQNILDGALRAQTFETLSGPSPSPRFQTRAEYLLYKQFHETHHVGQVLALREQLGLSSSWPF
jgi:uncharacterized damage-inducible protein DinB